MRIPKRKGYLAERKIRMLLHKYGWVTIKSGGSLGPADLVCLRKGRCVLMQVKSTRKRSVYFKGPMPREVEGFPLYVVVDFGYRNIRVFTPGEKISRQAGILLKEFVENVESSLGDSFKNSRNPYRVSNS
jgi:Holliday junction resolvase